MRSLAILCWIQACLVPTSIFAVTMGKVLVTGGAGYIGSHTCKALKAAGYEPVVFDNLENGEASRVKWGPLIVGDMRSIEEVREVVERVDPVAVIHFAAYVAVGESVAKPGKYYRNNSFGVLNLLDVLAEREKNCPLIFSSTGAVYGTPQEVPTTEEYPLHPESPYAASKAIAEQMIQDYYRAYGQHYCILRYFNACGSDPDGELGADPYKETRVVAVAMKAGILHQPFSLFGTDWPTPDQTAVRDYIHVSDLAGAHVAALHALLDGRESSLICNLGIGRGLSVFEIIQGVEEVLGYALDVRIHPRRPGDVAVSIADATRMRTRLHFEPSHSSLKEIMRTTYRWQSHLLGPQNQLRAAS